MKKSLLYLIGIYGLLIAFFVSANEIPSLEDLSLEDKIAQMIITEGNIDNLPNNMVGGVYGGFIENGPTERLDHLQSQAKIPLFTCVDVEGGEGWFGGAEFPAPSQIKTVEEAEQIGAAMGRKMLERGYNTNFAPVADLGDDLLGWWKVSRSFGTDPEEVSKKVAALVKGVQSEGVWATAKHFPGKTLVGGTETHDNFGYAKITEDDIAPFKAAAKAGVAFIMVNHVITTGVIDTKGKPSSVSKPTIDYLRTFFDGLIVTDSLLMNGVRKYYDPNYVLRGPEGFKQNPYDGTLVSQMYVDAVKAGVDLILDSQWDSNQNVSIIINAVRDAVLSGEIDESRIDESVQRILEMKKSLVTKKELPVEEDSSPESVPITPEEVEDFEEEREIKKETICGDGICEPPEETKDNCCEDCGGCKKSFFQRIINFFKKLFGGGERISIELEEIKGIPKETKEVLFYEDFSDASEWFLDEGWEVIEEEGEYLLKGKGHKWVALKNERWSNYTFKAKFKPVKGYIHFNYMYNEVGGFHRYLIGIRENTIYLDKQVESKFYNLAESFFKLDGGKWHEVEIRGYEGILNVYIDDTLIILYKDDDPLLDGTIAFETLDNSEFLIDDVEIKVITEKDITYP